MRPIMLQGHTRAITQIKYNREGDLLFSAAKDSQPSVWYSSNGERLGTYDGHKGVVWCIDVDWQSNKFLSGSGDATIRLWDCETGKELSKTEKDSAVRTCLFAYSGSTFIYSTDDTMSNPCEVIVSDVRASTETGRSATKITIKNSRVTSLIWGASDSTFITGHKNGLLKQWDLRTNKIITSEKDHHGSINDMQSSIDGTMFITASQDQSAKLFDTDTLKCLKTYLYKSHLNSAAISPNLEDICVGGGGEAFELAHLCTPAPLGKFETWFFHLVSETEFGKVKGHFGPVNTVAYHPNGTQYASGAEDGLVRIHNFDESYFSCKNYDESSHIIKPIMNF